MDFIKKLFGKYHSAFVVSKRGQEPEVYHVDNEAYQMSWAIEKARLTINYFKKSILNPRSDQQHFSIKAKMPGHGKPEYLWMNDVSFDSSNVFYGTIDHDPITVKGEATGSHVTLSLADVADWMIIEDGRLIGGYTIRAIRDELSGKQLKEFDENFGVVIDEGIDYFEHDFTTPEGAILCIEDAYDTHDLEKVMACKDFEAEAKLMLSHVKDWEKLVSNHYIVTEMKEVIRLSFIKHLQQQGFPSFKNITRAFPKREFIREDLCIVTEVCQFPNQTKSKARHYVSKKHNEWKVLSPAY